MIIINSPLMHKKIIALLESQETPSFTFIKQEGIKLYFESSIENSEEAAAKAKSIIKSDPLFSSLLIKVNTEEYI